MNGLAMVQVGNLYRIVQVPDSTRLPIHPQVNMKEFPDDESMLLNMVFLKYMTATELENILQPFLGESATVKIYAPANLLIIQDNSRNMKRTMELINLFDSDQFAGQRVQIYSIENSSTHGLGEGARHGLQGLRVGVKRLLSRKVPRHRPHQYSPRRSLEPRHLHGGKELDR